MENWFWSKFQGKATGIDLISVSLWWKTTYELKVVPLFWSCFLRLFASSLWNVTRFWPLEPSSVGELCRKSPIFCSVPSFLLRTVVLESWRRAGEELWETDKRVSGSSGWTFEQSGSFSNLFFLWGPLRREFGLCVPSVLCLHFLLLTRIQSEVTHL